MRDVIDKLDFDYPECLRADFGTHVPLAVAVIDEVLGWMTHVDFAPLARRSPGLRGFDWANYLRCSIARMVHVAAALDRRHARPLRVLDYGSYFGNFALMQRRLGAEVDAVDSYRAYDGIFDRGLETLHAAGVRSFDFADVGHDLRGLEAGTYDLVMCMGVIEHIPATPRFTLEGLDRVLRPGGLLVMDTPNLVHVYNRLKFSRGQSVLADLDTQYHSEQPFEGHHREYTLEELFWMLREIGHTSVSAEAFNYSSYGQGSLVGRDVYNHWVMVRDPTMRELLMTVSQKPARGAGDAVGDAWETPRIDDPETFWQRAMPAAFLEAPDALAMTQETLIVNLQEEVNRRDRALTDMDACLQHEVNLRTRLQEEVNKRDRLLRDVETRLQTEIQLRDRLLADLRRKLDWLTGRAAMRAISRLFEPR